MTYRGIRKLALAGIAFGLAMGAAASWWMGSQLVDPVQHGVPKPADFPAQTLTLHGDRHSIAGWWLNQGSDSPVVLLLHPIRADRSAMLGRARLLAKHGYSVLLIDMQAHGETAGPAITMGWRESADVDSAVAWLHRRAPGRRVGAIGCSLGGAALLFGHAKFDAVVLEAVYPRVAKAVENRVRIRLGPLAPVLTPLLLVQIHPRLHVSPSQLEPIRYLGQLHAPILIVAGAHDQHTTLAESQELFAAASPPKQLWIVPGARHQDFLTFDPRGYEARVLGFLSNYLRPGWCSTWRRDEQNRRREVSL
jgi:uncharacterized protein